MMYRKPESLKVLHIRIFSSECQAGMVAQGVGGARVRTWRRVQ